MCSVERVDVLRFDRYDVAYVETGHVLESERRLVLRERERTCRMLGETT